MAFNVCVICCYWGVVSLLPTVVDSGGGCFLVNMVDAAVRGGNMVDRQECVNRFLFCM